METPKNYQNEVRSSSTFDYLWILTILTELCIEHKITIAEYDALYNNLLDNTTPC